MNVQRRAVQGDKGLLRATMETDPFHKTQEKCCLNCQFRLLCVETAISRVSCDTGQNMDRVRQAMTASSVARTERGSKAETRLVPIPIMAAVCWAAFLIHYRRGGGGGHPWGIWCPLLVLTGIKYTCGASMCTQAK
jgi:hypothetical protein